MFAWFAVTLFTLWGIAAHAALTPAIAALDLTYGRGTLELPLDLIWSLWGGYIWVSAFLVAVGMFLVEGWRMDESPTE